MPTTRTYHVGEEGRCRRQDNLTGPWIDLTINVSLLPVISDLYDVETDPTNGDKVIVVGKGLEANGHYGIYISTNAGANWVQPSGTYSNNVTNGTSVWHEVFYYDTNTIFVVGQNGYMAVSTDGGLTFNLSTQIPATPTCSICPPVINGVFSVHFISATTGVVGLEAAIAKTTNAGATWTISPLITAPIPIGDASKIRGIHMSASGTVINIVSQTGVFRSSNSGSTWTCTYDINGRIGEHLTWTSDNDLWVFCKQNLILKSTNAGLTWSVLRAQTPSTGVNDHYAGHFYQYQNGFYSTDNTLDYTTDGAVTGTPTDSIQPLQEIYAVWTWVPPTPVCYAMVPCNEENPTFYVDNDFENFVGEYIEVCPTNLPSNQVNNPSGVVFSINQNPQHITQYVLKDCCNNVPDIQLSTYNLNTFLQNGYILQIDQIPNVCWRVIKGDETTPIYNISGTITGYGYANCSSCTSDFACVNPIPDLIDCGCYKVEESTDCESVITLTGVDDIESFTSCEACETQHEPPCYTLTNCEDDQDVLLSYDDLSLYVDLVIQIESCPGKCYIVEEALSCVGSTTVLPVTASFATCIDCNPPVVEVPKLIIRRVEPGYSTLVCPPEYVEKVNCTFSEAMHNEVLVKRYGLENCCTIDAQKWTIKKELMDLKMLELPTPPKPTCYCYSITQNTGTNSFKYIDCTGCIQQVTLSAEEVALVCAMYKPSVVCPTDNQDFEIVFSENVCESNVDCQAPPCYCYQIKSLSPLSTVTYINCKGEQVGPEPLEANIIYICAQEKSVSGAAIDIEDTFNTCTGNTDCQPI
jgi:photosystem II stability/assembly factor-like uncharacterized protein